MDTLINFDEVVELLANPPTLAPCPNFTNLPALRRHMQRCLNATANTLGQHGYVQNAFSALAEDSDNDVDDGVATIVTQSISRDD